MTTLTAKILEVTAKTPGIRPVVFKFKAYELPNLVILVPYEGINDGFFLDRDSIECCGCDEIESVEETGETLDWSIEYLKESIDQSIDEFGEDDATSKAMELIHA